MDFNQLATTIDIVLYKYNYIDNQIFTRIKNEIDYISVNEDSVVVSCDQVSALLETYYARDINKIKSVGSNFLYKEVTTPWFLYQVCNDMMCLKFIKFTLNTDKKYTRLLEIPEGKVVKFDFKVLSMTVNLFDFFTATELKKVNKVLVSLGLFEKEVPYARIQLNTFLDTIDQYIANFENLMDKNNQEVNLLAYFLDLIDPKIDQDNPIILFVTDY